MIKNLDSIKVSYARVDLGGVVRKCGSSLEFTGKAYNAIIAHYEENYLQSKGVFAVYMADNNWNYSKVWECPLDFSTLQYDANVVSIGCVDNSVAAIIKANKKSKYEFNVSDLKDSANLLYNGVVTRRTFTFNIVGQTVEGEGDRMVSTKEINGIRQGHYAIYVPYIGVSTDGFSSDVITCYDQQEYIATDNSIFGKNPGILMKSLMNNDHAGFITCLSDCTVHIDMDMKYHAPSAPYWNLSGILVEFVLVIGEHIVWRQSLGNDVDISVSIHGDYSMKAGERLSIGVSFGYFPYTGGYYGFVNVNMAWWSNTNTAFVNESHYENKMIEINVIKPLALLQNLIDKMFASREDIFVKGDIDEGDSLLSKTLLVAAESIRAIAKNKIYTSFTQFCDFMEAVYGYVYTIEHIGYLMDAELDEIDRGERVALSHIRTSNLRSESMDPLSTAGYYKMLPVGGVIDGNLGEMLDLTTPFTYEWEAGHGVNFMEEVYYIEDANIFAVQDYETGKWYANFVRHDAVTQGDWYNEDGHAKEMIGIAYGTWLLSDGTYLFGIVRNGSLVFCDKKHVAGWLDSKANNSDAVNLTFKHRADVFNPKTIKSLQNVNNLSFQFDDSKVFSDIEVGYPKEDYDNDNSALNEFNFTNYYKTDCDLSEQTLSLICPYRADCYGVEELLVKKKEDESTDNDNDIFIIITSASEPIDGCWQIDRSITVQNAYTETVFNAAIAPNLIIKNNEEYIGVFAKKLKFTSSDANSGAVINGVSMSANQNITKQLFKAGNISIDTDDHAFPENWDGIIEFAYAGKTYKGYLDSIDICFANMGTITYNIIEKCIE